MKKVKRRLGRSPLKKFDKYEHDPNFDNMLVRPEVQEVLPPSEKFRGEEVVTGLGRENPFTSKSHRCTYFRPSNEDFGQLTDKVLPPDDWHHEGILIILGLESDSDRMKPWLAQAVPTNFIHDNNWDCFFFQMLYFENQFEYYQNLLKEITEPGMPGTTKPELKNACEGSVVQTRSAFVEPASGHQIDENLSADLVDEAQWQTIDSISEADGFLSGPEHKEEPKHVPEKKYVSPLQSQIRISDTPRVKRIAEKFSKFKRNNIELRKLEERVVCLEYDVFDSNAPDSTVPLQKLRAFFSIKMEEKEETNDIENINSIPSDIKRNFNIEDGDLHKLNKREIEIIDDKIPENRSLLEDLKRVLRRKRALEKKKRKQTLDLMCLYEMAKRESPPMNYDYSNTNLLSKAELQEIKDLILKKCASSVYGINRKTVRCTEDIANDTKCIVSNSLLCELMREAEKV